MNTETSLRRRRDGSPYGFEELMRFRVLLLTLRRELSKSFEELSEAARRGIGESLGDLSSLPQHLGDWASDVSEVSMAFAFLGRVEAEMTQIDDALERIDNRSYGLCEGCDQPVPEDRLLAIPMARLCIRCRRADER